MRAEFSNEHWRLCHHARYAQRLCERTARLYRRVHTASTFLTVVGGSAALSAASAWAPPWLPGVGALLLALFGAVVLAVRPAERAALNEADVRRYAEVLRLAEGLDDAALAQAFAQAQLSDAPEVEPLREVAYNDMVTEIGRTDLATRLSRRQRLLRVLA